MTSVLISSHRCTAAGRLSEGTSIMESTVNVKRGHPETDWIETGSLKVVFSEIPFLSVLFSLLLLILYIDCPPQGQNKPRVQTLSLVKLMKRLWVCQRGRIKWSNRFLWDRQKCDLLSLSDPQNETDRFCYCSFNALPTHSLGPSSEIKCINI